MISQFTMGAIVGFIIGILTTRAIMKADKKQDENNKRNI